MLGDRFNDQLQSLYTKVINYLAAEIGKAYDEGPSKKATTPSGASKGGPAQGSAAKKRF